MSPIDELREALAEGVIATSQHGEAVVVDASVSQRITDAACKWLVDQERWASAPDVDIATPPRPARRRLGAKAEEKT